MPPTTTLLLSLSLSGAVVDRNRFLNGVGRRGLSRRARNAMAKMEGDESSSGSTGIEMQAAPSQSYYYK